MLLVEGKNTFLVSIIADEALDVINSNQQLTVKFVYILGDFKLECQMDSVCLLKLPDTRATSQHHYVKDRLMMNASNMTEKNIWCGSKIWKK